MGLVGGTRIFPSALQAIVNVIDHDMTLIMRLCHRLHVLASGQTISEGDVDTVSNAPQVIEAYLGSSYAKKHVVGDA